jgi:hypothetical protein
VSSNHGADRRAGAEATTAAEATRTATPLALHVAASTLTKKSKNYDARSPPRQVTTTASPPSLHGFAILPEKVKPLGITKYDAKQDPV